MGNGYWWAAPVLLDRKRKGYFLFGQHTTIILVFNLKYKKTEILRSLRDGAANF